MLCNTIIFNQLTMYIITLSVVINLVALSVLVLCVQVIWKYFYSSNSAQDHGTLYQLRNKLNRTNVVTKPKNNVNACEDFVEIVTSGLIISSALEMLSLNSVDDMPSDISVPGAEEVWTLSADERRKLLLDLCRRI